MEQKEGKSFTFSSPSERHMVILGCECVWSDGLVWSTPNSDWHTNNIILLNAVFFLRWKLSISILSLKCYIWTHHLRHLLGSDKWIPPPDLPFTATLAKHKYIFESEAHHTRQIVTSEDVSRDPLLATIMSIEDFFKSSPFPYRDHSQWHLCAENSRVKKNIYITKSSVIFWAFSPCSFWAWKGFNFLFQHQDQPHLRTRSPLWSQASAGCFPAEIFEQFQCLV